VNPKTIRSADLMRFVRNSPAQKSGWLRGLDSNQDNQLQRLACYQLHYPGVAWQKCSRGVTPSTKVRVRPGFFEWRACRWRRKFLLACLTPANGEVSERFKEHAWKACV